MARIQARGEKFAVAAPGVDADLIAPFTPDDNDAALRISVQLATAATLYLRANNGTAQKNLALGSGALEAGRLYTFTAGIRRVVASATMTYTLRTSANVAIDFLSAEEIQGGAL